MSVERCGRDIGVVTSERVCVCVCRDRDDCGDGVWWEYEDEGHGVWWGSGVCCIISHYQFCLHLIHTVGLVAYASICLMICLFA